MSKHKKSWNGDFYTQKARKENYKARSVYKLLEIDEKFQVLRKGMKVLDLGCAPGSWTQFAVEKTGMSGKVVGIDIQECSVAGAEIIVGDINTIDIKDLGKNYDVVISDMAPATSGNNFVDAQKSLELSQIAFNMAEKVLKKNGSFVCKIFQGEDLDEFFRSLKSHFTTLKRFKPKSSRDVSFEIFIIGKGFK